MSISYAAIPGIINLTDSKLPLCSTDDEFKCWIIEQLYYKYDMNPSSLALKVRYSLYLTCYTFEKLRSIAEQTRSSYYRAYAELGGNRGIFKPFFDEIKQKMNLGSIV